MRETWVYWVSRDSFNGVLADFCNIWWIEPKRAKGVNRITWCPRYAEPGHFGHYSLDEVRKMYRVIPDTDLELIRVEQWSTEEKK